MSLSIGQSVRTTARSWFTQELDRLEAPDQSFIGHRDILTRSMARYHFVAPQLKGTTLDVGCGRGYGFDILQRYSGVQIGVDISREFLRAARGREAGRPLALASGERLPFAGQSFDAIIAFEVIEHIEDDIAFLRDLRRLARPDATIAISTPNRLVSSGGRSEPLNPFHVREYLAGEFARLLAQEFSAVTVYGQYEGSISYVANSFVDRIPMRWKYLIPSHLQGIVSVIVRPPLRLEDCHFAQDSLDRAHTFVALCRV